MKGFFLRQMGAEEGAELWPKPGCVKIFYFIFSLSLSGYCNAVDVPLPAQQLRQVKGRTQSQESNCGHR